MISDGLSITFVRRRLRRFVELLVVAAVAMAGSLVTSTATAPPAAADVAICNILFPENCPDPGPEFPPPPLMYLETSGYGGSPAQNASLRNLENAAVQAVLDLHGLPASDENAVRSWGREQALAQLYLLLVDAIRTSPAQRTVDQQNAADWAAEQARRRNADAAFEAAREYVKWAGLGRSAFQVLMYSNPSEAQIKDFLSGPVLNFNATSGASEGWCVYRSPAPYGDEYQGFNNPLCNGPFIGLVLPPTPTYDQFVRWGAAKAHFLLLTNNFYADQANRLGSALGFAVPLSVVVSAAATYAAAARIAAGTARLAQTAQLSGRIMQATSFTSAVASLIVASVSLALTIIAAIVTAVLVGIDVTNAANLPGKLASLVATARSTVPDPVTLVSSTESASSLASIFVAATAPAPNLERCDNARSFPGFAELTLINSDEVTLTAFTACLNATLIPPAAPTDQMWSLVERSTGATTTVQAASFQTPSGPTTARFNNSWFVTQNNGTTTQTLRLVYTDWDGNTQNAWVIADAAGYSFLTFQPPTDAADPVEPATCIAEGTCGVSQTIRFTGSDGKQYTGSIRRFQATTGTPSVVNAVAGSPATFNSNGFAPGGAIEPVSYAWTVTVAGTCGLLACTTVANLTGANPTFTFAQSGNYDVQVRATDATGLSVSTTFRIAVGAAAPTLTFLPLCAGAAAATCNTFAGSPGVASVLRSTIGYPSAGSSLSVQVDWGDGTSDSVNIGQGGSIFPPGSPITATPVSGQNAYTFSAPHAYGAPGTYEGTMRVTNPIGLTGEGPSVTLPFTIRVGGSQVITFASPGGSSYGNVFGISATGGASGQPVTFAASGSCSLSGQTGGTGTGSATVTVSSAGMCTITASQAGAGVYRAAPDVVRQIPTLLAPLSITASSPTVVYGQSLPAITPSYSGFRFNDTAATLTTAPTCSVTSPGTAVGTYATTCTGAAGPNYSFGYVAGTLTIQRAPLTVTAPNATMAAGDTVPSLVPSYSGFVGNDGPGVVSGVTCAASDGQGQPITSATAAGSYPVTCSGGTAANYQLSYEPGSLTIGASTRPPAAPSGVGAVAAGSTVTVEWIDESADETGFEVQRARNVAGQWAEWTVVPVGADTTTFSDAVPGDGPYAYLVRAVNAFGASDWVTATVTVSAASGAPTAPTGLTAVTVGGDVAVRWTDAADDEFGYELLRAKLVGGVWTEWTSHVLDRDADSFADIGVADGTYAYVVRSYNSAGASEWEVVVVTIPPASELPAAVEDLTAAAVGTTVSLAWTDAATDELGFELMRARLVAGEWTEWTSWLAIRDSTSATDDVPGDGVYAYLVRTYNDIGSSAWTIQTVVVSSATTAPDAPTGLTATRTGTDIVLNWTDESEGADGELWFELQRAEFVGGDWTGWTAFVADAGVTTFTDGAVPGGVYAYLVRAHNALGDSSWTVTVLDES